MPSAWVLLIALELSAGALAISSETMGPLWVMNPSGGQVPSCADITRDQMQSTASFDDSTMDNVAAALCAIVRKSYAWMTINVYPPGETPDTHSSTGFVVAKPNTLEAAMTYVEVPKEENGGGFQGEWWWPYGFNQAYGSVWSSSGATCENALQAFTGFDTTVKYVTDGDGNFGLNDTWLFLHEHVDSSPMLLSMSANNGGLSDSSCVAVWSASTDNRVTIYENYVGPKDMELETLWDGLVSVVYLTNFDTFYGAPIAKTGWVTSE